MAAFLLLAVIPLIALGGVFVAKWSSQRDLSRNQRTYKLAFPSNLDPEQVIDFLRTLSGTLVAKTHRFIGVPTVAFEAWGTQAGIEWRMRVPWTHTEQIVQQLRTQIPGMRIEPEDRWPERREWTRAVEVGLTQSERQLRIYNAASTSAAILASLQPLNEGETLMVQWVVSPCTPAHPPVHGEARTTELSLHALSRGGKAGKDEVTDRREKLSEPNVLAVLRVGAMAPTTVRGEHLVFRVRSALMGTRGPATKFIRRFATQKQLAQRIAFAAAPITFPMQLSAPELATLLGWPIGNPFVSGLPAPLSKQLPAPLSIPQTGRVIGRSTFPGDERPVAVGYAELLQHKWMLGSTGSGKSVALANFARQDMENGYGLIVIEPQGSLVNNIIDLVPEHRRHDVIVLDVNDTQRPVGFNLLQQGNPHAVADELTQLFDHLYGNNGVWARELFFFGLRTLAYDDSSTFVDLASLVMPKTNAEMQWRQNMLKKVSDPTLREYWRDFDAMPPPKRASMVQPVIDRIWQLNARREIRNIIGQPQSTFFMDDVIRDNKILLINMSKLPKDTASLMGTLFMSSIWRSVQTVRSETPTFLYLDEFQTMTNLPIEPDDMLARARGLGLGLTLAHQHLDQLPNNVQQAVMNNAKTKIVFQASSGDSAVVAREFGTTVDQDDLQHLGRYEAMARIMTPSGMSPPITVAMSPPAKGNGFGKDVLAYSRQKYGRPVKEVEDALLARKFDAPEPLAPSSERPVVGGDWT